MSDDQTVFSAPEPHIPQVDYQQMHPMFENVPNDVLQEFAELASHESIREIVDQEHSASIMPELVLGSALESQMEQNPIQIPIQTSGSESGSTAFPLDQPTDMHKVMAGMGAGAERQNRFVMTGDPQIISDFWTEAQARGKVNVVNGARALNMSNADAEALFRKVAAEAGAGVEPLAEISLKRDGSMFERLKADGLGFNMFRDNEVRIFAAGRPEQIAEKRAELAVTGW